MISDLIPALTELRDSRPAYEEAHTYYEGEAGERFASEFVEELLGGKATGEFDLNMARRPVAAILDRLEISAITCPDEGQTKVLGQIWEDNDLDLEAPEIHENTLQYGDAFLFVWPSEPTDDASEDEPEDDGGAEPPSAGVDMFYNSPLTTRIIYDPEHPRRKKLVIKSWCETDEDGNELVRVNLYYGRIIEKWISKAKTEATKAEDFEPYIDDHTDDNGVMDNPYGEPPFFHFRTRRPYGRPEHKDAYGPQNAVTKLINNQMTASDFAAFPQRVGLLDPNATTDDDTDWGHDETADPEGQPSQMISRPGSMWILRNYKDVKEFAAADVANFLEPIKFYIRGMSTVTATPVHFLDPTGDAPSGESQRAANDPLVKKVNARQLSVGGTWQDAAAFALKILGFKGARPKVRWKPPQIITDLEGWQAVIAKQQAGVPVRQTLLEAGYTEAELDSWGYTEDHPDGEGVDWEQMAGLPRAQAGAG